MKMSNQKGHIIPIAIILIIIASYTIITSLQILAQTDGTITIPQLSSSTQQITTIAKCEYAYSKWSDCMPTNVQIRTIISKKPDVCIGMPEIKRDCSYSAPSSDIADKNTTSDITTNTTKIDSTTGTAGAISVTSRTSSISGEKDKTSTSTATSLANDIPDATPKFVFTNISVGQIISGTFSINGRVADAKNVEYFLVPFGSNTAKYIGTATYKEVGWTFVFNSTQFPNGSFYIVAKIKNAYGSYDSSKVRINIANLTPIQNQNTTEDVAIEQAQEGASTANEQVAQRAEELKIENFNGETSEKWQNKFFGESLCLKREYCGADADPDKDGLINKDEMRFNTDPKKPDSDGDGFLDGDEVKNGFDPTRYAPGDKTDRIIFESPKEKGEIKKETYSVTKLAVVNDDTQDKKLKLEGKGLPNSFINVYIYSEIPIILTVKTDADGNWSYTLDKDLENGNHEVYVAITDNTGKIQAKSEVIAFVKTAEAVSVIPPAEATDTDELISPVEKRKNLDLLMIAVIIAITFAAALAIIGLHLIHKHKNPENLVENFDGRNL